MEQYLPGYQEQHPFPNRETLETLLIAQLLQDYSITHLAQTHLLPEDFESPSRRIIYEAILNVYAEGEGVDIVTVNNHLAKHGLDQKVGAPLSLIQITDTIGSTIHFRNHLKVFKEWRIRHNLLQLLHETIDQVYDQSAIIQDTFNTLNIETAKLQGRIQTNQEQGTGEVIDQMWHNITSGQTHGRSLTTMQTLNTLTQGARKGDLIIIAGRPGSGKSILATNIIQHAIEQDLDENCALFSLEMENTAVMQRLMAAMAQAPHDRLSAPAYEQQVLAAINKVQDAKLLMYQNTAISAQDVRSQIINLKANHKHGVDTVIIDHGGLLNHINPGNQNSVEEIGNTSKLLKQTAMETGTRIILLWQLNRQAAKGVRPSLADLRGSGRLEEDADKVIFVHRPELYQNCPEHIYHNGHEYSSKGLVEFILAKNRSGSVGETCAKFTPQFFQFADY